MQEMEITAIRGLVDTGHALAPFTEFIFGLILWNNEELLSAASDFDHANSSGLELGKIITCSQMLAKPAAVAASSTPQPSVSAHQCSQTSGVKPMELIF